VPHFAEQLKERHHPTDWKLVLEKTSELMVVLGDNPLTPSDFARIKQPVMITLGDKDAMVTRDESEAVVHALPNAQLRIIPDTPHPIEKANLAAVVAVIREHIAEATNYGPAARSARW
jgi:pimeloyl-ACP methyl ester carboxylesterase